mmetsp:Transcript_5665/g.11869  ORF Transcript_5665/g.11869 Transcript_5665/m.11869 type:complete len:83 (-) Transcript_5665:2184-2432(-)
MDGRVVGWWCLEPMTIQKHLLVVAAVGLGPLLAHGMKRERAQERAREPARGSVPTTELATALEQKRNHHRTIEAATGAPWPH